MRTLAIECATEACSLALFDGSQLVAFRHEVLGRGHAEQLVPLIAQLPDRGRADEIRVSLGPGSFTGIRIGLAAAGALAIAWRARVRGYPTLALVAAAAQAEHPGPVTVCMAGGHGDWFVAAFSGDGLPRGEVRSLPPDDAVSDREPCADRAAGNRAHALAQRLRECGRPCAALDLLPDARFAMRIPHSLLSEGLAPIYGRPPDAALPPA